MVEEVRLTRIPARHDAPPNGVYRRSRRLVLAALVGLLALAVGHTGILDALAQTEGEAEEKAAAEGSTPDLLNRRPDAEWPDPETAGMREIIDSLKARERALERREQSLAARESDLRQVEKDLQARLEELQAERAKLEKLLTKADESKEVRIRAIVKMVESMRAGDAAKMVEELDDDLAVSVLSRMNKTKGGKLLAQMDSRRAAFLAEKLAAAPPE